MIWKHGRGHPDGVADGTACEKAREQTAAKDRQRVRAHETCNLEGRFLVRKRDF